MTWSWSWLNNYIYQHKIEAQEGFKSRGQPTFFHLPLCPFMEIRDSNGQSGKRWHGKSVKFWYFCRFLLPKLCPFLEIRGRNGQSGEKWPGRLPSPQVESNLKYIPRLKIDTCSLKIAEHINSIHFYFACFLKCFKNQTLLTGELNENYVF